MSKVRSRSMPRLEQVSRLSCPDFFRNEPFYLLMNLGGWVVMALWLAGVALTVTGIFPRSREAVYGFAAVEMMGRASTLFAREIEDEDERHSSKAAL